MEGQGPRSSFRLFSACLDQVLVTGGAGFVGSHVADALLSRGDTVIIVDELNDYYDVRLKRANLAYLTAKHDNLTVYEVRALSLVTELLMIADEWIESDG
jgi:nucleoside-diphosphate-sugar epimerase